MIVVKSQSQQPSTSDKNEINLPQIQASTQQQKTENDKRGTDEVPFVVKTIPTAKSQSEAEEERKEHKEKSSQGWWTIWLTAAVAIATIFQALFLYFSLWATKKAAEAAERSANVAAEQSHDMKTSLNIAEKSVYAAKETANIMRAQDRAYLFVNVKLYKDNKGSDEIIRINETGLTGNNRANINIINHGKTPAIIKSFHCKVDFYTAAEVANFFANYWMTKSIVAPEADIIESGKDITYPASFYIHEAEQEYLTESTNDTKLLCVGRVEYEDVFNNNHETIFCWEFRYLIADFYICEQYRYNYRT